MAQQAQAISFKTLKAIGGLEADEIITLNAGLVRLGGANGYMEVPMYADTLLGIWAHNSIEIVTAQEDPQCWGYLESADGMSLKPFEFLFPPMGACLITTFSQNATPGEYYPINAPVRPGSRIIVYAQALAAAGSTGVLHPSVTFWFSNSRESGDWAPTSLDSRPGVQRYRKVGAYTATVTGAANAWAAEAAYQVGLGAGGGIITELGGVRTCTTPTAATPGLGIFRFNSDDVPLFPQDFACNAYGSLLGGLNGVDAIHTITRRQCHVEGESVVLFRNEYQQGAGLTLTTDHFITMIEFIRGA